MHTRELDLRPVTITIINITQTAHGPRGIGSAVNQERERERERARAYHNAPRVVVFFSQRDLGLNFSLSLWVCYIVCVCLLTLKVLTLFHAIIASMRGSVRIGNSDGGDGGGYVTSSYCLKVEGSKYKYEQFETDL